jgi:hypothetical protein
MSKLNLTFSLDFAGDLTSVGDFFDVDGLYDAGLSSEDASAKRLYCRDDTENMLNALNAMNRGIRIFGPPGVGMSITVWFWLCYQVRNFGKTAFWINVSKNQDNIYVMLSPEGNFLISFSHVGDIPDYIRTCTANIIVIDGVTYISDHRELSSYVFSFSANPTSRQAIFVASLSVKINREDDENHGISYET